MIETFVTHTRSSLCSSPFISMLDISTFSFVSSRLHEATQFETMPRNNHYELRNVVINPTPPPPTIDVVLVTGDTDSQLIVSTCERFAKDFGFYYLSVPDYLDTLRLSATERPKALGLVHPDALREIVQSGDAIPGYFLPRILRHKIDGEVMKGCTKFIILGLGKDHDAVMTFMEDVCA